MPLLAFLPLGPALQTALDQTHEYQVTFNGSSAGSSTWSASKGAFKGSTALHIGPVTISEEMAGAYSGDTILSFTEKTDTPSAKLSFSYSGGVFTVVTGADKPKTIKFPLKDNLYAGNLMPALWESSLRKVGKDLLQAEPGTSTRMNVPFLDAGAFLPVTFRLLPTKTVAVAGAQEVVHRFQISVGPVQMELDTNGLGHVVAEDVPGQKLRLLERGWEALYVDPLAAYPELSQPNHAAQTQSNVKIPMRDGVKLASDLDSPSEPGKYPAILIRTPYGRGNEMAMEGDFYAKRGYVVVAQDCRGKGDSEGNWDPFVTEGDDGYDAIQWIAKQPWSNGNVGMIGASYSGYVQWAAAVKNPPALKCIVPQVSPPDAMHNLPYDFGIPFLYADIWWARIVEQKSSDMTQVGAALPHPNGLTALPLNQTDQATLGNTIPFYQAWLKRTTEKDWKGWDFLDHLGDTSVPAFHISGWWDGDGIGTKLNWAAERRLGRKNQWLIYGPWSHFFNTTSSIGKVDYGPSAIIDLDSLYLRWFDTWLKGKSVKQDMVPRVKIFVTGENKWETLSDWPDASGRRLTLYLGPSQPQTGKPGHGIVKNGKLSVSAPAKSSLSYVYNPASDVEVSAVSKDLAQRVDDFTDEPDLNKAKQPVLDFRSAPLTNDTAIAGPVTVDLFFTSSAQDTDLYATIVDIDEKDTMHIIGAGGKIRASYRFGMDKIVPLEPGKVAHVSVQPWDFAHEVKKGHRIGVLVLASGFPAYARNLGTMGAVATNKKILVQRNKILFGAQTPSRVTFQILWQH